MAAALQHQFIYMSNVTWDGKLYRGKQLLTCLMEPNWFEWEARFEERCTASGKERNVAIGPIWPTGGRNEMLAGLRWLILMVGQTKAKKPPCQQTSQFGQTDQQLLPSV